MGREYSADLSGLRDELISGLRELRKEVEKEGKKVGQAVGDGYEEGYEESVEEVRKSKEELLRELGDAKKRFEQNLNKFPNVLKKFFKTLDTKDLTRVSRALNKALNDISNVRSEFSNIGESFDIGRWLDSMKDQAESLFESFGAQKEAIQDVGKALDEQKQKLEKPVEVKVDFKNVDEAKQRIKELRKEMIAAAHQLKQLQGKPLNQDNSQLYVTSNDILTLNQKEIDGIVAQLKKQGVAVRNTTAEYRELQTVLEDIGLIEKKENKRKPVNEDKQPTKQVKKQKPVAEKQVDKVVEAVEKKENHTPQVREETKAIKAKAEATQELLAAQQKLLEIQNKQLKLSRARSDNGTVIPQTYTAVDGKYTIEKGTIGWNVRETANGRGDIFVTYETLNELRKASDLIAEQEAATQKIAAKAIEENTQAVEENIKAKKQDIGYHAGDLGKADSYGSQAYSRRSTGHFGTGTYFVGDQKQIEGYNSRDGVPAPVEQIDFGKYNLFTPRDTQQAYELHSVLQLINHELKNMHKYDGVDLDLLNQAVHDGNTAYLSDFIGKYLEEHVRHHYEVEALEYRSFLEDIDEESIRSQVWGSQSELNGLSSGELDDAWLIDEDIIEEQVRDTIDSYKQALQNFDLNAEIAKRVAYDIEQGKFESISDMQILKDTLTDKLSSIFVNKTKEEISNALENTFKTISGYSEREYYQMDSASTVFMKQFGYEGIDTRHTELDNTTYGSVIYDLKDEDLARRQEILSVQKKSAIAIEQESQAIKENSQVVEENIKAKSKLQSLSDSDKKVLTTLFQDRDSANRNGKEFDPIEELSMRVSAGAFKRLRPRVKDIMNNAVSQLGLEYFGEAVEHYLNGEVLATSETLLFTLFEDYFKQDIKQLGLDKFIEDIGGYPEYKRDAVKMLNGLSINYPDFINYAGTYDLDTIDLRVPDVTPQIKAAEKVQQAWEFSNTPGGQVSMFEGMSDPIEEAVDTAKELGHVLEEVVKIPGQMSFDDLEKQNSILPELTIEERQVTLNSGAMDNLFRAYNITDVAEQQYVYDAFAEMGQVTKAIWTKINTDGKVKQDDELFVQLQDSCDKATEAIMMFGTRTEDTSEDLKSFYTFMSGKKIKYDQDIKTELGDAWADLYNKYKGRLTTSPTGLDVNKLYQQLAGIDSDGSSLPQRDLDTYRGLFPSDIINPKDQFEFIFDVLDKANAARAKGWKEELALDDVKPISDDVHRIRVQMTEQLRASMEKVLDTEEQFEEAVENANQDIKERVQLEKQAADHAERMAEAEDEDSDDEPVDDKKPVDANWILKRDQSAAIDRARLADANVTPVVDLSGIYSVGNLETELRETAKRITGGNDLTFGKLHIDESIASIKLFNKELGKTVVDWYEVAEAADDATKTELKYLKSTLDHDAEAARKYKATQDKKISDSNTWLIQQLTKLDKQEVSYRHSSKKISGDTEILNLDDRYFGKTIDELAGEIRERLQKAMGGTLTDSFKNEIRDALRVLDMEIRVEQSEKYKKGRLSAQESQEAKATNEYKLETFETKAKNRNVFTQLEEDIRSMRAELESVTTDDTSGLDRFIDKMKTAEAHFAAEVAKEQGVQKGERNYKQALQAQERLYDAQKELARLEATGKTDVELSRRVKEREAEYRAAINLLETETHIAGILERETALETELKNIKQQAEADQAAKKKATEDKQFANQLRSYYSEWMKILGEINNLDSQLNNLNLKDKGTGLYSSQMEDIQNLKSGQIAGLRELKDSINKTLSLDGTEETSGFNAFLEYCRKNAILTADEIQNLNKVLMQSEHISQDFAIKSAEQQQKAQQQKYEELVKLQKQYNEADYGWHQADISGGDKSPYNAQMESYLQRIKEIRKELELTAEQQVELDKINNQYSLKKDKLYDRTTTADLRKENRAFDAVRRAQNLLYGSKMSLADLELKGDTDSVNYQKISRAVEEREEQYQASLKVLSSNERINAALEREIRLNEEVEKFKRDGANKQAQQQQDDELKEYYAIQNERLKAYAKYGYQYGTKTVDDRRTLDSMSEYYKQEEIKAEQFAENIRTTYNKIIHTTKQMNDLDTEISALTFKDKGSGLYSGWIDNLQTQKSSLIADMRQLSIEISDALSVDPSQALHAFFERAQNDAIVTSEEYQKFTDLLIQTENIKFNFGAKVAEQTEPIIEKIKHLRQMIDSGVITDQGISLNVSTIESELNKRYNAFKTRGASADAIDYLKYANDVSEYITKIDQAAKKEAEYFAAKKAYANVSSLQDYDIVAKNENQAENAFSNARQALEQYVKTFYDSKAIVTDFTTNADGISKINFSVFDEGANQFRMFSAEMGQCSDKIYTYETSLKNMTIGSDSANEAMRTLNETMASLQQFKYSNPSINVDDAYHKLKQTMDGLAGEQNKVGSSKDFGSQMELKKVAEDAKKAAEEIAKLVQQWLKTKALIESHELTGLGTIDQNGDVYAQMYAKIQAAAGEATISNVKFDESTKTLSYTLIDADKNVKDITAHMDQLTGTVVIQEGQVRKLKNWWQDLGSGLGNTKNELVRYVGNMLDVASIIQSLRQGFNVVLEIDTALTELRKVTDETDIAYQRFLQNMSKSGAVVGSTVKDLTTSAADWARLNI